MKQPESTPAASWLVERCRAHAFGIAPGILPPGPLNALADVANVRVGHVTLSEGDAVRAGVTAIRPPATTYTKTGSQSPGQADSLAAQPRATIFRSQFIGHHFITFLLSSPLLLHIGLLY